MTEAFLRALSVHLPADALTNEALAAAHPGWDLARLERKIGIKARRVVAAGECASDLAFEAARRLLDSGVVDRSRIDGLLLCTQSPDYFLPTTACILQDRLGLPTTCAALDFNQGCSGYVYGLMLAKGLVAGGLLRNVLLLTAETYTRYIHPDDRVVRPLFGDGATATLVTAEPGGARLGAFEMGTDGSGFAHLIVPAGGARTPTGERGGAPEPDEDGLMRGPEHLYMDGRALFDFTLARVPEVLQALMAKTGLELSAVDWFVMHQANAFMNEHLRAKLKIPKEKAPLVFEAVGNTVSNTIPIALASEGARFRPGDRVVLTGFGVGFSWGACLLDWGEVHVA